MSGYVHIDIDLVPQMQRDKLRKVAKKCGIKITTHQKNDDLKKLITDFYNAQEKRLKSENKENEPQQQSSSSSSESADDHTSPTPVKSKSKILVPPSPRGRKRYHDDSSQSPYHKKSSRKKNYRSSSSEDERRKKKKSDKRIDDPFKEYCKRYEPSKPNEDENWKKILRDRMDAEHALTTKYRDELFDSKLYDSYKKVRTDIPGIIKLLSEAKAEIETAKYTKDIRRDLEDYIVKNKQIKDSSYREKFYKLETNVLHKSVSLIQHEGAESDEWLEECFKVKCTFYSVSSGLPAHISLDFNLVRKGNKANEDCTLKLRWLKGEDRLDLGKEKYQTELAKFLLDSKVEEAEVAICMDFIVHALLPQNQVGWVRSRLPGIKDPKNKKDTKKGSDSD